LKMANTKVQAGAIPLAVEQFMISGREPLKTKIPISPSIHP